LRRSASILLMSMSEVYQRGEDFRVPIGNQQ
jgi:hypothetical protein